MFCMANLLHLFPKVAMWPFLINFVQYRGEKFTVVLDYCIVLPVQYGSTPTVRVYGGVGGMGWYGSTSITVASLLRSSL